MLSRKIEEVSEQKTANNERDKNYEPLSGKYSKHFFHFSCFICDDNVDPTDEPDKFRVLDQWLLRNGARYPKLELRDYGNEVRGCHATEEIPEDEVIIHIPLKCIITVEMGKETDVSLVFILFILFISHF